MIARLALAVEKVTRWRPKPPSGVADWFQHEGQWWLISFLVHAAATLLVGIITAKFPHLLVRGIEYGPGQSFEGAEVDSTPPPQFAQFELGDPPIEPSELNNDVLRTREYRRPAQTAQYNDDSPVFTEAGGGTVTNRKGLALGGLGGLRVGNLPGPAGAGGLGVGHGLGDNPGSGGAGYGFGGRGTGHREALVGAFGGTRASERAVAAALNWLFRHQNANGSWSLQHTRRCTSVPCSAPGEVKTDAAATAMALLAFLGAGQTHTANCPYKHPVNAGIFWLVKHQARNGDLSATGEQRMYSHALATIALCEAYGMTKDEHLYPPAQAALAFIETAQNQSTGGWRYEPGDPGDTSVTGWQVMALRSGQMAGLAVNPMTFENTRKWIRLVAKGDYGGLYSYQPFREVTPAMTAVGMLCNQYLGMKPNDPPMLEGKQFLVDNLPDNNGLRSTYYWYYATLAMHNLLGPEWDKWNRQTRRVLIESQTRDGCAVGSWDPTRPTLDSWGQKGGRLMMTSLATLTLEVYYRYLPLFKFEPPAKSTQLTEAAGSRQRAAGSK